MEGYVVSDYRIKISVSNARIRRAMESSGYKSVLKLCKDHGLVLGATLDLVNMKISPLNKYGEWRICALKLADALNVLPDELFSEQQKVIKLKTSVGYRDVTESELSKIINDDICNTRIEDLKDNDGIREIAQQETKNLLKQAMESSMSNRQLLIVKEIMGIDTNKKTIREVAIKFDITSERIRQIYNKGIKNLQRQVEEKNKIGKILIDLKENTEY